MPKKADKKRNKAQAKAAYAAKEIIELGKQVHWGNTEKAEECIKKIFPPVVVSRKNALFEIPLDTTVVKKEEGGEISYSIPVDHNVFIDTDTVTSFNMPGAIDGVSVAQWGQIKQLMHIAVKNGNEAIVKAFIDAGLPVNGMDTDRCTALHNAASEGHDKIVELLIKSYASPHAEDKWNNTPLHYAASKGHLAVVKELLKWQSNLEAQEINGMTPLHLAASNGHLAVVKELLKVQSNLEVRAKNGMTPLHLAASHGHLAVVKELLKVQSNLEVRATNGMTPLDLAVKYGHTEIVESLQGRGATNLEEDSGSRSTATRSRNIPHVTLTPNSLYAATDNRTGNRNFKTVVTGKIEASRKKGLRKGTNGGCRKPDPGAMSNTA